MHHRQFCMCFILHSRCLVVDSPFRSSLVSRHIHLCWPTKCSFLCDADYLAYLIYNVNAVKLPTSIWKLINLSLLCVCLFQSFSLLFPSPMPCSLSVFLFYSLSASPFSSLSLHLSLSHTHSINIHITCICLRLLPHPRPIGSINSAPINDAYREH